MKRTKQHEIDTKAIKILESQTPVNWVLRRQEIDYGLDYQVQVFDGENPTNIWFMIQLKGTEALKIDKSNRVTFSFKVDTLKYYQENVPFPVFLLIVDVVKEDIYWIFLQKYIIEKLPNQKPTWEKQEYVTIYIPINNLLKKQIKAIEVEAYNGMTYSHTSIFGRVNWQVSLAVKNALNDPKELEQARLNNRKEGYELDFYLANKYYYSQDKERSYKKVEEIFNDTKDKEDFIEQHFSSLFALISFKSEIDPNGRKEIFELSNYGSFKAQEFKIERYNYLFKGINIESQLYQLIDELFNFHHQKILLQESKNILWPVIQTYISEQSKKIAALTYGIADNLFEAIKNRNLVFSLELLTRYINLNLYSYYKHIVSGIYTKNDLHIMINSIQDLIKLSHIIADALSIIDLKLELLKVELVFNKQINEDYQAIYKEIKDLSNKYSKGTFLEMVDSLIVDLEKNGKFPEGPDDFPKMPPIDELTEEEIEEVLRQNIKIAGIDIENGNDEYAEIARIGLKDRNPERVLKHCSNLELALGPRGAIADITGLPTAGSKILYCKHASGTMGFNLDNLYDSIKHQYCNHCKFQDPMPREWKWSYSWQQEKDNNRSDEFKRFLTDFNTSFFPKQR